MPQIATADTHWPGEAADVYASALEVPCGTVLNPNADNTLSHCVNANTHVSATGAGGLLTIADAQSCFFTCRLHQAMGSRCSVVRSGGWGTPWTSHV